MVDCTVSYVRRLAGRRGNREREREREGSVYAQSFSQNSVAVAIRDGDSIGRRRDVHSDEQSSGGRRRFMPLLGPRPTRDRGSADAGPPLNAKTP